jgi:hypothetical protein
VSELWKPVILPEHTLLIVEERLKEQQAEGVRMPEGMPLDELALRVLIAAESRESHLRIDPTLFGV